MAPSDKQAAAFSKERRLDDGGIQHDNTDDYQEEDVQTVAPLSVSPVITARVAVGVYSTSKSPFSHDRIPPPRPCGHRHIRYTCTYCRS